MSEVNLRKCIHCGRKFKTPSAARNHEKDAGPRCGEVERERRERQNVSDDLPDGAWWEIYQSTNGAVT